MFKDVSHQASSSHLPALTSVRIIAAMMVFLGHISGSFSIDFIEYHYVYKHAVPFFFVLSGFILMHRYGEGGASWSRFYLSRFARLWPAHMIWLVLAAILVVDPTRRAGLVQNIFLLQSWSLNPLVYYAYNGVSWSISTEMALYVAFPVLLWGAYKNWFATLLVCIATHLFLFSLANDLEAQRNLNPHALVYTFPLSRLTEFFIGMLACVVWKKSWSIKHTNVTEIACVLLFAVGLMISAAVEDSPFRVISKYPVYLAFAVLLVSLAQGRGFFARALSWRPFVYGGEISFALYLSHQVVIRYFEVNYLNIVWFSSLNGVAQFFLILLITLFVSSMTYHFGEMPMRNAIRSIHRKRLDETQSSV